MKHGTLSDTNLASRLDTVFGMDRQQPVYDCYRLVCKKYGLEPSSYRMDSTDFPFYGTGYGDLGDGGTLPEYGGNSKNRRNDLLQKNVQAVCDRNGMVVVSRPFDGNVSDIEMNEEMLKFLDGRIDCKNAFVVGDTKLVSSKALIERMDKMGLAFVSKVPKSFGNRIRDDIVFSALTGVMDESATHGGRFVYGTTCEVYGKRLRFVAYCLPGKREEAIAYLSTKALEDLKDKPAVPGHQRFYCEKDAGEAFGTVMKDVPAGVFGCGCSPAIDRSDRRENPDGPYRRAYPGSPSIDGDAMEKAANGYAVGVSVTDIPFATEDCENIRFGATDDTVVDTYLSEYRIEHAFRFLKSGLGMDRMSIRTPSGQDAVIALSSVAFVLGKAADTVLKKTSADGKDILTMKRICDTVSQVIVKYDRDEDTMKISGWPGATSLAFPLLKRPEIEPELLLGYR